MDEQKVGYSVRPAITSDMEAIRPMARAFFMASRYSQIMTWAEGRAVATILTRLEAGTVWVATLGDRVIGFLVAADYQAPWAFEWITAELALWVEPEHRQSGAGGMLVRQLCAHAIEVKSVECQGGQSAGVSPVAAEALYLSNAFRHVGSMFAYAIGNVLRGHG